MDENRLVGEVLASRYLVEERLGKGATGVVYRARHVKVGRGFAVKVLNIEHADDASLVRRFEREAELGGMVRHPNVISVVDVGETPDGARYMVMELATGVELTTLIAREAPMPAARVIALTRQILEGLYHAHERGVIHRDLKPDNILVDRDDTGAEVPRIVDFGIAIARDEAITPGAPERLTTGGLVLGTPHYMAPEQATGVAMDHRIDLFALGVILFEMLSGAMPFDGDGVEVARANLLEATPAMASRSAPGVVVDPLLEAFTHRLLEKNPPDRPADAKAARELLDLIDRDPVAAGAELGVHVEAPPPRAATSSKRAATEPLRARTTTPSAVSEVIAVPTAPSLPPPFVARAESEILDTPTPPPPVRLARASEAEAPLARPASRARLVMVLAAVVFVGFGTWLFVHEGPDDDFPAQTAVATTPTEPVPAPTPAPSPPPPLPPIEQPAPPLPAPVDPATPKPAPRPQPPRPAALPGPAHPLPAPAPAPPKAETADTSVAAVARLYGSVGKSLQKLAAAKGDDAVSDLWPRYRLINIQTALASPDTRQKAHDSLTQLERDVVARAR